MSKLVEEIRFHYPHPVSAWEASEARCSNAEMYCVGGAFINFLSGFRTPAISSQFPGRFQLSDALRLANPYLTKTRAFNFATDITAANDEGDFDMAWSLLEYALEHKEVADAESS